MIIVLLFLTAPLAYLPEAVLSAIVFLIGIDLIDIKGMRSIFAQRRSEFWVALITLLMVVSVGVEQGIILAIALSLIDHTRCGYRPKNVVLLPATSGVWNAKPVATRAQALPGLIIYRFNHSIYYANSQKLLEETLHLVKTADPPLRWFCLEASAVDDVDYSAAKSLRSIFGIIKEKGIRIVVAQVLYDVKAESHYQLRRLFGEKAFYETLDDVVKEYRRQQLGDAVYSKKNKTKRCPNACSRALATLSQEIVAAIRAASQAKLSGHLKKEE